MLLHVARRMRRCLFLAIVLSTLLVLAVAVGAQTPSADGCDQVLPPDLRTICERGELRIARYSGERPPFFFERDGQWVGFDVDLGRDLAGRLGVRYVEDNTADSFDAVVDRVASGAADLGLSKLSATLARARRVRFTKPYLTVYQALLVHRLSAPAAKDPFDALNDSRYTIGALAGTSYVGYVGGTMTAARAQPYHDFDTMMADVVAGDIDAVLMDSARADSWRRANSGQLIHVRTTFDKSRSDPLAIAVGWENTHLLAWVELYLDQIRANGTAEELYDRWFREE